MARDADGNYYYDAGTVNEQFDNIDVVEDSDGNLSLHVRGEEARIHQLGFVFSGKRQEPSTNELAEGEYMLFVSDGSGDGTDGSVYFAHNDGGTIELASLAADADFA